MIELTFQDVKRLRPGDKVCIQLPLTGEWREVTVGGVERFDGPDGPVNVWFEAFRMSYRMRPDGISSGLWRLEEAT